MITVIDSSVNKIDLSLSLRSDCLRRTFSFTEEFQEYQLPHCCSNRKFGMDRRAMLSYSLQLSVFASLRPPTANLFSSSSPRLSITHCDRIEDSAWTEGPC